MCFRPVGLLCPGNYFLGQRTLLPPAAPYRFRLPQRTFGKSHRSPAALGPSSEKEKKGISTQAPTLTLPSALWLVRKCKDQGSTRFWLLFSAACWEKKRGEERKKKRKKKKKGNVQCENVKNSYMYNRVMITNSMTRIQIYLMWMHK